jgi:nucleotide-binding universal stress UspA family protein
MLAAAPVLTKIALIAVARIDPYQNGPRLPGLEKNRHGSDGTRVALAKRGQVTVLMVLQAHTFTPDTQMIEDTPAQYRTRMQQHAEESLGAVAAAAQAAGVVCETVQVEHEHPY